MSKTYCHIVVFNENKIFYDQLYAVVFSPFQANTLEALWDTSEAEVNQCRVTVQPPMEGGARK